MSKIMYWTWAENNCSEAKNAHGKLGYKRADIQF